MAEWTRRRVLLLSLGLGSVVSGWSEHHRRRRLNLEQSQLTELALGDEERVSRAVNQAFEGDRDATAAVERIRSGLDLPAPAVPYDRARSKALIQASRMATEQYLKGKYDLSYDGSIQPLPAYDDRFEGYTQIASIRGRDMVDAEQTIRVDDSVIQDPLQAGARRLRQRIQRLAGQSVVIRWSYPVHWGFALRGKDHQLLVLRGTQRGHEWLQTIHANQIRASEIAGLSCAGSIHRGFATIYAELSESVLAAARQLDPSLPLYVSGHSLGSPLATLAALNIAEAIPEFQETIRLYSYAGPRLGDPDFAEAFSTKLPNSYRIINQADLVPRLPPTKTKQIVYVHLGEPWAFSSDAGDIGPNHFISAYRKAIEAEREERRPFSPEA